MRKSIYILLSTAAMFWGCHDKVHYPVTLINKSMSSSPLGIYTAKGSVSSNDDFFINSLAVHNLYQSKVDTIIFESATAGTIIITGYTQKLPGDTTSIAEKYSYTAHCSISRQGNQLRFSQEDPKCHMGMPRDPIYYNDFVENFMAVDTGKCYYLFEGDENGLVRNFSIVNYSSASWTIHITDTIAKGYLRDDYLNFEKWDPSDLQYLSDSAVVTGDMITERYDTAGVVTGKYYFEPR